MSCSAVARRSRRSSLSALALFLATVIPVAHASTPPTIYTGGASSITQSSATIKGSLHMGEESGTYYFEYGPTPSYGAQTAATPLPPSTQTLHVTAAIAGLSPATAYHFRLVVIAPSGPLVGQDSAFLTKPIPLAITLQAPSASVLFGSFVSIAGTVTGTAAAGRNVVLQADPFPYVTGFRDITPPVSTDANGSFALASRLLVSTKLRVATTTAPPVLSPEIIEHVALRVTLHVRATRRPGVVRFYGTVSPGPIGGTVRLQRLGPGARPHTVATAVIERRAGASPWFQRTVPHRPALYRALVAADGSRESGHSEPILLR